MSRLVVPDGCANTIPVVIQAAVKSDPDINKIFGFIDFSFSDFDIRSSDVMLFVDRFILGVYLERNEGQVVTDSYYVQPRTMNSTSNIGMGMPIAHSSIQPIAPVSFCMIFDKTFIIPS